MSADQKMWIAPPTSMFDVSSPWRNHLFEQLWGRIRDSSLVAPLVHEIGDSRRGLEGRIFFFFVSVNLHGVEKVYHTADREIERMTSSKHLYASSQIL
jgi:hypothetical protein